jgi:hypothetical protein
MLSQTTPGELIDEYVITLIGAPESLAAKAFVVAEAAWVLPLAADAVTAISANATGSPRSSRATGLAEEKKIFTSPPSSTI